MAQKLAERVLSTGDPADRPRRQPGQAGGALHLGPTPSAQAHGSQPPSRPHTQSIRCVSHGGSLQNSRLLELRPLPPIVGDRLGTGPLCAVPAARTALSRPPCTQLLWGRSLTPLWPTSRAVTPLIAALSWLDYLSLHPHLCSSLDATLSVWLVALETLTRRLSATVAGSRCWAPGGQRQRPALPSCLRGAQASPCRASPPRPPPAHGAFFLFCCRLASSLPILV